MTKWIKKAGKMILFGLLGTLLGFLVWYLGLYTLAAVIKNFTFQGIMQTIFWGIGLLVCFCTGAAIIGTVMEWWRERK